MMMMMMMMMDDKAVEEDSQPPNLLTKLEFISTSSMRKHKHNNPILQPYEPPIVPAYHLGCIITKPCK